MLKEFDLATTSNKEVLICHFSNSFKLSICAQSNKYGRDLDIWEEIIKKVIDAKPKVVCQPQFLSKEIDNKFFQGH